MSARGPWSELKTFLDTGNWHGEWQPTGQRPRQWPCTTRFHHSKWESISRHSVGPSRNGQTTHFLCKVFAIVLLETSKAEDCTQFYVLLCSNSTLKKEANSLLLLLWCRNLNHPSFGTPTLFCFWDECMSFSSFPQIYKRKKWLMLQPNPVEAKKIQTQNNTDHLLRIHICAACWFWSNLEANEFHSITKSRCKSCMN